MKSYESKLKTARCTGLYFKDWDLFRKSLSLMHNLERRYGILEELKQYWLTSVDYIDSQMDAGAVISCMHQLVLLIVGNMANYYPQKAISIMLVHALKHCVRNLGDEMVQVKSDGELVSEC